MTPATSFPVHRLPAELQILIYSFVVPREKQYIISSKSQRSGKFISSHRFIFLSKRYRLLASGPESRAQYHAALGDYIMNEAREITVNVVDLDFTNFRACLNELSRKQKLPDFAREHDPEADKLAPVRPIPADRRRLNIVFINTTFFPNTMNNVLDFAKTTNRLLKKLPAQPANGFDLCITAKVHSCEDLTIVANAQEEMRVYSHAKLGEVWDCSMLAFAQYRTEVQLAQQAEMTAGKEYWDQIDRVVASGFTDPIEHYAHYGDYEAAAQAQRQAAEQQALAGAEEDQADGEGNPTGSIADEDADTDADGMEGGANLGMELEDEEDEEPGSHRDPFQQPPGLYNPPTPAADFQSHLDQVIAQARHFVWNGNTGSHGV